MSSRAPDAKQQDKETNPLTTAGKSAWNVFRYQLPSGTSATGSALRSMQATTVGGVGVVPNFSRLMAGTPYTVKDKEKAAEHIRKSSAGLLNLANKLNKDGVKFTGDLVNSLDKIEGPLDAINWAAYALGQAAGQIPAAVATGGMSALLLETGEIYQESVRKIAEEKGLTVEEVINEGLDSPAIAFAYGTAAAALERVGAGQVLENFGKNVFGKEIRGRLLDIIKNSGVEAGTEAVQTLLEQIGASKGANETWEDALKNVDIKEIIEAAAQGAVGGGGITATGQVIGSNRQEQTQQEDVIQRDSKKTLDSDSEQLDRPVTPGEQGEPVGRVEDRPVQEDRPDIGEDVTGDNKGTTESELTQAEEEKQNKQYRVHVGNPDLYETDLVDEDGYIYFNNEKDAVDFTKKVQEETGEFLNAEEVVQENTEKPQTTETKTKIPASKEKIITDVFGENNREGIASIYDDVVDIYPYRSFTTYDKETVGDKAHVLKVIGASKQNEGYFYMIDESGDIFLKQEFEGFPSKPEEVEKYWGKDEAVKIDVKKENKPGKPQTTETEDVAPKPKRKPAGKKIQQLAVQSIDDAIATMFYGKSGIRLNRKTLDEFVGKNIAKEEGALRLNYLSTKEGIGLDEATLKLMRDYPQFEGMDEKQVKQAIADFITTNPKGPSAYVDSRLETQKIIEEEGSDLGITNIPDLTLGDIRGRLNSTQQQIVNRAVESSKFATDQIMVSSLLDEVNEYYKDPQYMGMLLDLSRGEIDELNTLLNEELDRFREKGGGQSNQANRQSDVKERPKTEQKIEEPQFEENIWASNQPKVIAENVSKGKEYLPQEEADKTVESWKREAREIGRTEDHKDEVIISLFDYTGNWTKAYDDAGYTTIHIDIQHMIPDKTEHMTDIDSEEVARLDEERDRLIEENADFESIEDALQSDQRRFSYGADMLRDHPDLLDEIKSSIENSGKKVVGVLAAPPCTTFSGSGARWWKMHDTKNWDEVFKRYGWWAAKHFDSPNEYNEFLARITEEWIYELKPQFHAIENPVGRIGSLLNLPEPQLTFNPNLYGDPYTKKTQLWGKFNPDLPQAKVDPVEGSKMQSKLSSKQKIERSTTPEGFAYAFFMANNTSKVRNKRVRTTEQRAAEIAAKEVAEKGGTLKINKKAKPGDQKKGFTDTPLFGELAGKQENLFEQPKEKPASKENTPDLDNILDYDGGRVKLGDEDYRITIKKRDPDEINSGYSGGEFNVVAVNVESGVKYLWSINEFNDRYGRGPNRFKPVSKSQSRVTPKEKPEAYKGSVSGTLPLNPKTKSDFAESDLDNVTTLRQIAKSLINKLDLARDKDVRTGLIRRFTKRARGLFFRNSGIVRVNNLNDVETLVHELGHWMDFEVFQITENLKQKRELSKDAKAHRKAMKAELLDMLDSYSYPERNTKEGVAEFIKHYVMRPEFARRAAPKFNDFFENFLDQSPNLRTALETTRGDIKSFGQQDPRQLTEATISREKDNNTWLDGVTKFGKNLEHYLYDNLKWIRTLDENLRKKNPSLESSKSPLLQALSILGIDGQAKQYLENHPFQRGDNEIAIIKDVKGYLQIINPLIKKGLYKSHEGYLTAKRNVEQHNRHEKAIESLKRLKEMERMARKLKDGEIEMTEEEETAFFLELNELRENEEFFKVEKKLNEAATLPLDASQRAVELYEEQFGADYLKEFRNDIYKYQDEVLKYYRNAGMIDQATYAKIKRLNNYYVPFKRFFDEFEQKGSEGISVAIYDEPGTPVKRIKGSQREVVSPFESIIKNTYQLLSAANRNESLKTIVDALQTLDKSLVQEIPIGDVRAVKDVQTGEYVYTYKVEKPKGKNIITIRENGKMKFYEIPKEYYDDIFATTDKISNLIKTMSIPSRLLQAGAVVYDPTFAFRNIFRDQTTAWFYTRHGYNPLDFAKGLFATWDKSDIYQKYLASGADMAFLTASDQILTQNLDERVGSRLKGKWSQYKKNPILFLSDINRASEIGTRVGAFKKAYLKTGDVFDAMREAREIAADYGIRGTKTKEASLLIPFFNARLQHFRMTKQALMTQPRKVFAKGFLFVTVPSLLNWLMNNMDDDDRELYQSLPNWRRMAMWNIRIPGTDSFLPVPKGFFGVLFGTSVEAVLDEYVSKDPSIADKFIGQLVKEIAPGTNFTDYLPQVMKPFYEQVANKKSFTGGPVVYDYMKNLPAEEQYTSRTPEIYKEIGKVLNISPIRMDVFIGSTFGGAGSGAVIVADEILQTLGFVDKKPEDTFTKLGKLPLTKAIITPTPKGTRSQYTQDFYDKLDEMEGLNQAINQYISRNETEKIDQFLSKKGRKRDYEYYVINQREINKFRTFISTTRKLAQEIKNDPKITDKREKIDYLENIVSETALEFKKAYESENKFRVDQEIKGIIKDYNREKRKKQKTEKQIKSEIKRNARN